MLPVAPVTNIRYDTINGWYRWRCTSQLAKIVVENFWSNLQWWAFQMQVIKNSNFVQNICTSQDAKVVGKNFWSNFYWWAFQSNQEINFFKNSFALLKLQKLLSRTFVQIVAQFKFLKMGQWRFVLKPFALHNLKSLIKNFCSNC